MSRHRRYTHEIAIAAPPAEVWRALTEAERIRQWFGWDWDGLDDEVRTMFVDPVVEADAPHRLVLRNWVGDEDVFELSGDGATTIVRLVHSGQFTEDDDWDDVYDDIYDGWTQFLFQLRFYLEHHREALRGTWHWWQQTAGTVEQVFAALMDGAHGFDAGAQRAVPAGQHTLAARVVHAAQFGGPFLMLAVPELADALLFVHVAERPATPGQCGIHLTLSAWGDGRAHIEAIGRSWSEALARRFPDARPVFDG